ncbi:hypothetical protein F5884DRAFT_351020 [Xylogone sp. PMI_703]|nr:hypothetical protein F5884DRAFT_351020 [Xylogone sp. PMI_703]
MICHPAGRNVGFVPLSTWYAIVGSVVQYYNPQLPPRCTRGRYAWYNKLHHETHFLHLLLYCIIMTSLIQLKSYLQLLYLNNMLLSS